jgi:Family of unknown function (DUF5989)
MAEETKDAESVTDPAPTSEAKSTPEAGTEAAKPSPQPPGPEDDEDFDDSILSEFMTFLKEEKKWWLAPLVIVLLLLSAVIIFAEGSAIAPFIYTIF